MRFLSSYRCSLTPFNLNRILHDAFHFLSHVIDFISHLCTLHSLLHTHSHSHTVRQTRTRTHTHIYTRSSAHTRTHTHTRAYTYVLSKSKQDGKYVISFKEIFSLERKFSPPKVTLLAGWGVFECGESPHTATKVPFGQKKSVGKKSREKFDGCEDLF